MRASNSSSSMASSTTGDAVLTNWRSPMPYLFGGLALMLGLIAVALLILACSFRKTSSSNSTSSSTHDADQEKPAAKPVDIEAADSEPKVVVIMAGDITPTYLAKPITSNSTLHQTHQNI